MTSTWKVDGGDDPSLLEILFLATSEEDFLLRLTWTAPEGENAYFLKEVNGIFEETAFNAYRYSSQIRVFRPFAEDLFGRGLFY
ncbi:MAG: hypothetical protein K0R31_771 [Clostridiales bacterium]|nr:hypothetical protein [Clostridiales bacterium]